MDLIDTDLNNRQVAATCPIAEKPARRHIGRAFAELHPHAHAEDIASLLGTRPAR